MGLFGNNDVQKDVEAHRAQALLQRYGLENLSDPRDMEAVQNIAKTLSTNKYVELGTALQANGTDAGKLSYLRAIVEQNFIMIRQLDRISQRLEGK